MNEKMKLLKRIQMCGFALTDAGMYLDTHPSDYMALEYYKKYEKILKQSVNEYEIKYGPLEKGTVNENDTEWHWVSEPWPWEISKENTEIQQGRV